VDVVYALAFPENIASAAQTAIPVRIDFVMILPSFRCNAKRPASKIIAASAATTKLVFRGLNSSLMSAVNAKPTCRERLQRLTRFAIRASMTVLASEELECSGIFDPAERHIESGIVPTPLRKLPIASALRRSYFLGFWGARAHATGKVV
jgi:hypothetical protein